MHRRNCSVSWPLIAVFCIVFWLFCVTGYSWNFSTLSFGNNTLFGNRASLGSGFGRKIDGWSQFGGDALGKKGFRLNNLGNDLFGDSDGDRSDRTHYTDGFDEWQDRYTGPTEAEKKEMQKQASLPLVDRSLLKRTIWKESKKFCKRVGSTVAIVGNGPVSEKDRQDVGKADTIVRFNKYYANRRPGERTDLWVLRYNERPPTYYWGLDELTTASTLSLANSVAGMIFLGGDLTLVENLPFFFPGLPMEKVVHFPYEEFDKKYFQIFGYVMGNVPTIPSSGLLGILMMLGCYKTGATVHLYGFNFHSKNYPAHIMHAEEFLVQQLQKEFDIVVHETPCNALHSCSELVVQPVDSRLRYDRFSDLAEDPFEALADSLRNPWDQKENDDDSDAGIERYDDFKLTYKSRLGTKFNPSESIASTLDATKTTPKDSRIVYSELFGALQAEPLKNTGAQDSRLVNYAEMQDITTVRGTAPNKDPWRTNPNPLKEWLDPFQEFDTDEDDLEDGDDLSKMGKDRYQKEKSSLNEPDTTRRTSQAGTLNLGVIQHKNGMTTIRTIPQDERIIAPIEPFRVHSANIADGSSSDNGRGSQSINSRTVTDPSAWQLSDTESQTRGKATESFGPDRTSGTKKLSKMKQRKSGQILPAEEQEEDAILSSLGLRAQPKRSQHSQQQGEEQKTGLRTVTKQTSRSSDSSQDTDASFQPSQREYQRRKTSNKKPIDRSLLD